MRCRKRPRIADGWTPLVLGCAALASGAGLLGCGDDEETLAGSAGGDAATRTTTSVTSTGTGTGTGAGPGAGSGGTGGTGGSGGTSTGSAGTGGSGGGESFAATPLTGGQGSPTPFDAAPGPDGAVVYFTGFGPNGAGVFAVSASGGAATELFAGAPLAAPLGIATSTDGSKLFVADAAATDEADQGLLLRLSASGGAPAVLAKGFVPRGLDVHEESDADQIYFTGRNASDGAAGVFKVGASGGAVSVVAKGSPFVEPSGVAVAPSGEVYVVDASAGGGRGGAVLLVAGGKVETVASGLRVGYPAGIALGEGGAELFVSSFDPATHASAIARIDLGSGAVSYAAPQSLSGMREPGGLHRAEMADVFAFVDGRAQGSGAVFLVTP